MQGSQSRTPTDSKDRTLQRLTWCALVLTFFVIGLGAYTRLADAGLGCPDWPGCYGQLAVPMQSQDIAQAEALYPERPLEAHKAWLEMIHRYFAGTLGLLVFSLSYLLWRRLPQHPGMPLLLSGVIIAQAALGMWTVTLKLMPVIVMLHLLGGFTLFSLLALVQCRLKLGDKEPVLLPRGQLGSLRTVVAIATLLLVAQIGLGGWTSSNYAALMCTSLPICQGDWQSHLDFANAFRFIQPGHDNYEYGVLEYGARMTIHVSHRIGAMLVTVVLLGLITMLWRSPLSWGKPLAKLLSFGLLVQLLLGIANVVLHLPLLNAVLHNLGAAMLLIMLVVSNYRVWVGARAAVSCQPSAVRRPGF